MAVWELIPRPDQGPPTRPTPNAFHVDRPHFKLFLFRVSKSRPREKQQFRGDFEEFYKAHSNSSSSFMVSTLADSDTAWLD